MNDLTMAEIRELQELIQASELYGLTDEEHSRFLELKQRMNQDDFDDFLCATLFY
jgi:hypothetical protein